MPGAQGGREKRERSPREFFADLLGSTRRARLLTAATVLTLLVAVAAFVALPSNDDEIPQDSYTRATDRVCAKQKRRVIAVREVALRQPGTIGLTAYATALVPLLTEWREELAKLPEPLERRELVADLDVALREASIRAGTLARTSRGGQRQQIVAAAGDLDTATAGIESAIAALALEGCEAIRIGTE
jgi:hypothetical protein